MPSTIIMMITIFSLFYVWISCSIIETSLIKNYFNRDYWFTNGNIFHINNEIFRINFQQHRNVNQHINWLTDEISSLNHQIKSIRKQILFVNHSYKQNKNNSKTKKPSLNHRNIIILQSLSNETLFNRYRRELIEIYQYFPLNTVIECIAVINEINFINKHLLIKLSDGNIDKYEMNGSKKLKETLLKIIQPISIWNNDGRQLEYYQRFIPILKTNEIILREQFANIKNRPKITDMNFFDMMGQILRIKYHTDPSSLSCILEMFFGDIYTCDGRLVFPYELKFLSDDHDFFVFYAVMMDTKIERQIFPLDNNNHIRYEDQIFFLFQSHPQYQSLSSYSCTDCSQNDRSYILNDNFQQNNQEIDDSSSKSKSSIDNFIDISIVFIPQNYIVYFVVTGMVIYILIGIYFTRNKSPMEYSQRRYSMSSRRGR